MDDAAERRRQRASWPIRRHALGEEPDERVVASPSALVAMVHRMTLDAWAMSGEPIPTYARHESVGRVIRQQS